MFRYIYPILQSAYRTGHSTDTALLKVHNDIMCSMDQQRVSLLVLLDLSAAFDTVDHQVLLRRLEVSFGITGTALKWFKSYLTNRSQRVPRVTDLNVCSPSWCSSSSCLSPLLFTIYASTLFEIVYRNTIYLSFKPNGATNELDVICVLQNCIKDIRTWMTVDKLKLNDGKTEFLIIGTAAQLKKVNISSIVIGQDNVPVVSCARNLGVWFDR
jgi:hypothetical protein